MCRPTGGQWAVPVPSARCIPPPAVTPVTSLPAHRYGVVLSKRDTDTDTDTDTCLL